MLLLKEHAILCSTIVEAVLLVEAYLKSHSKMCCKDMERFWSLLIEDGTCTNPICKNLQRHDMTLISYHNKVVKSFVNNRMVLLHR